MEGNRDKIETLAHRQYWFRGSAWEPNEVQALPAGRRHDVDHLPRRDEAEPRKQCVPRQEPGNEC